MRNYLYFLTLILEKTPLGMKWYYFPYNEEYIYGFPAQSNMQITFSWFILVILCFWFICFPGIWFMFQTKNEVKSHSVCFSLLKKCCYPMLTLIAKVKSGERGITKLKYQCVYLHYLLYLKLLQFNALTKIYKIIKCTFEFVAHSSTTSFIWSRFVCISLYRSLAFKTIFNKSTFAFSISVFGYENNI